MVTGRLDRQAKQVQRINRDEQKRTGTHILYTPRLRCSCMGRSGNTNIVCRVCDGFGWFWRDEDEYSTRAILQSANLHRELVNMGFVQHGDLVAQFDRNPPTLAPYDRVRLNPDGLFTFAMAGESEIVERGTGPLDFMQQRAFRAASVVLTDPESGRVVRYRLGVDCAIAEKSNVVAWLAGGERPPEGTRYGVTYLADYDWLVTQPPAATAIGGVGFQGKILLSRRMKDQRDAQDQAADPTPDDVENWL